MEIKRFKREDYQQPLTHIVNRSLSNQPPGGSTASFIEIALVMYEKGRKPFLS